MTRIKKTRLYVIALGIAALIFSVLNPSLDIVILVAFSWYAYVWGKEFYRKEPLPGFKVYCALGITGAVVVLVRTVLFNI